MTEDQQGVPHDPQLSQLYRQLDFPEPNPAIDQAILQAARLATAQPQASKTRRLLHWLIQPSQLAAMASVSVLAFLGLLSLHRPLREEASAPPAPQQESAPGPATEAVLPANREVNEQLRSKDYAVKQQHTERFQSAKDKGAPAHSVSENKLKLNSAQSDSSRSISTETTDAAIAPAPQVAPAAAERKAVQQTEQIQQNSADTAREMLDKIRATLRANNLAAAKQLLDQFKHDYPEVQVPEDIRSQVEPLRHPASRPQE